MARIDEAKLNEDGGHRGMLEHVQLVALSDSPPRISFKGFEEALVNEFAQGGTPLALWMDPNFRSGCLLGPWRIVVGIRVTMDREEYLAVCSIRHATTFAECHVLIMCTGEGDDESFSFGFHKSLELTYDRKRNIFLAVPLEDGTGITPTVPSIKTYFH